MDGDHEVHAGEDRTEAEDEDPVTTGITPVFVVV